MTWNGSLGDIAVIECRYVVSYILVLLVGLVGGVLLSTCTNPSTGKRGSHEPTLSSVASVGSPKRVRNADFTSPVKVLHNIAGSFLRSSDAENVDIKPELQRIIKQAQSELFHILGVSIQPVDSPYVWQHVFSNSSSQFWMSSGRKNTIRLRGESSADSSAGCIVNYLLQHDLVTGIEGLGGKSEVISRSSTKNEVLIVRKFHCSMGSNVATSVFHLVTTISTQADGTYILATRSIPSDIFGDTISGSGSDKASGGRGIPHGKEAVRKELVGGVVYASGYLLRPVEFDGETGCEISFGCHLDLQGVTRAGRNNTANVNAILSAVLRTLKAIHNGDAECFRHLEGQTLSYLERVSAWGRTLRQPVFAQLKHSPEHSQKERGQRSPLQQLEIETDPAEEEYVQLHAPSTQSLSNAALPATADRYRLLSVARDAANRMRTQYLETLQPDSAGPKPRSSFSGPLELRRETFYDHDGVVLRELSRSDLTVPSVLGMLSATFTVQAPVEVVKRLLVERPDSVDGFVRGRSVLNHLSDDTYVQWLAYEAIFPLSAKDFLLVTTQEVWDKRTQRGFVIASTSIDAMCEVDSPSQSSPFSPAAMEANGERRTKLGTPREHYERTNLRLSGYVGIPQEDGSTQVTFLLDIPLDMPHSTKWLLRFLAQYALTELVGRIRRAVSVSDELQISSEGTEQDGSRAVLHADRLQGGDLTSLQELQRMAAGLQAHEQHAARRWAGHPDRVPVPNDRRERVIGSESPPEETRSRLNSDQSTAGPWREVQSIANSAAVSPIQSDGEGANNPSDGLDAASHSPLSPLSPALAAAAGTRQPSNPAGSPRTRRPSGEKHSLRTGRPSVHRNGNNRKAEADVDVTAVQYELGKISPSRRLSRTAERRRTMSQSEDGLPAFLPSLSRAAAALKSDQAHGGHGWPGEAWDVYSTYFDQRTARSKLGIDWQLKVNKPTIHIYSSMVEGNNWCAIKAVTIMKCTAMDLVKVLLNYDRMGEYDDMYKSSQLVQRLDANTVIQRLCFKEIWPTAPRDFVVCVSWRQNSDGTISIVSRSVPDTFCAQAKGYVRGFVQVSGYLLEPYDETRPISVPLSCAIKGVLSPGECKVTLLNHTELGGTLPSSVINALATGAPVKILQSLAALVQ